MGIEENGNQVKAADNSAAQSEAALNSSAGVAMKAVEGSAEAGAVKIRLENETDR
ncbi:hypothetical protein QMP26_41595 (plasmid) [Enterocloster clostridioformis]